MDSKDRFTIKEASRLIGVEASTLRYWDNEGLIRVDRDAENEYRQFSIHALIEASEIAFYRTLGVPIKTLKNYHDLSVKAFEGILDETQRKTKDQIKELEGVLARLESQQKLNDIALELEGRALRPGAPSMRNLYLLDYKARDQWELLTQDPQYYGIFIDRNDPQTIIETIADPTPEPREEPLWSRTKASAVSYLESLLKIDVDTDESNAEALFTHALEHHPNPRCIIGNYLVTAMGEKRWDYYHAWIECADR